MAAEQQSYATWEIRFMASFRLFAVRRQASTAKHMHTRHNDNDCVSSTLPINK